MEGSFLCSSHAAGCRCTLGGLHKQLLHPISELFGMVYHDNPGIFQNLDLLCRVGLSRCCPSSRMTHNPSSRGMDATDESHDGFRIGCPSSVLFDPLCSVLLCRASNLANHYNALCFLIMLKDMESFDKISPCQHIAPHANSIALPKSGPRRSCDRLIAQSPRLGDDTNLSFLEERQWLKPDATAAVSINDTWTVRADEAALGLRA